MAEKLKQHLQRKSEDHAHLRLLQSQWTFDEELIPKALQNIAAIFPHYSRHDSSHSRQILINIERLLGGTLSSLTATDTWLLLEAAFWHDIGMVVTADDIVADMASDEFKEYVDELASSNGHELEEFAKTFSSLDTHSCFSAADTPHEAVEKYRQVLAGFYRVRHPNRASGIVDDPWQKVGISSPRNELVPKRLFRLLGQICALHGRNFESVLRILPLREAGMATEDCHPRFVACLLRLGDLFDLDDNRFCPVMLRIAGKLPPSSQSHIEKHSAIRHFRLDPERVEITAECDGYESYEATDQWFRWIEDEFRSQMTHWNDIVPNRLFGLLPTLGKLEVSLKSYEILDPGQRPRFEIDPEQIFELLQGAGLYRDRWQSLRELLQNAVDATLMRIWLTHGDNVDLGNSEIEWADPLCPDVRKIFDRYPIQVSLDKIEGMEPGRVNWRLDIRDKGIGIAKQDLAFMRSVGGSAKNSERQTIIRAMPNWMRPSGAFGIGLQSAFMLAPEIIFESKSLLSGENLRVEMKSPIGQQRGLIYIQRCDQSPGRDSGTLLSITFDTEAIPKTISWSNASNSFAEAVLAAFDPIRMADIPYDAGKMVDEIMAFSILSPIPIRMTFNGQPINLENSDIGIDSGKSYFCPETGIMLMNIRFSADYSFRSTVAFRGQRIGDYFAYAPFVEFDADILSELAPETLTINRNNVKDTAREHVDKLLIDTVAYYIDNQKQRLTTDEKPPASAFLYWHSRNSVHSCLREQWRNLLPAELGCTIAELCQKHRFEIYVRSHETPGTNSAPAPDGSLVIDSTSLRSSSYLLLLFKQWSEQSGHVQKRVDAHWNGTILYFSKTDMAPFSDEYLRKQLASQRPNLTGGRCSMPVWKEFEKLSAEVNRLEWCHSLSDCHPFSKHFVLPFFFAKNPTKISTDGLDELCEWTIQHTRCTGITKDEIRALYDRFIDWVDNELMVDTPEWRDVRVVD